MKRLLLACAMMGCGLSSVEGQLEAPEGAYPFEATLAKWAQS